MHSIALYRSCSHLFIFLLSLRFADSKPIGLQRCLSMTKRRKKSALKKKKRSLYPWEQEENLEIVGIKGDFISTDAGWEELTFLQACNYFSPEEIRDWYQQYWEGAELAELLVELDVDIDLDNEEAVDKFFETYDWTQQSVQVVVAKAVYDSHRWTLVTAISTPWMEERCFENHEHTAIELGIHLRRYLNRDSLPIVNDSQDAVRRARWHYKNIGWLPRKAVKDAHNLKLQQASKIYSNTLWDREYINEIEDDM
ncbi:hypothetical protein NUACC26_059520 [Scytonema sp. NUACC26]